MNVRKDSKLTVAKRCADNNILRQIKCVSNGTTERIITKHGKVDLRTASQSVRPKTSDNKNRHQLMAPPTFLQKSGKALNYYSTVAQPDSNGLTQYRRRHRRKPPLSYKSQYEDLLYTKERKLLPNFTKSHQFSNSQNCQFLNKLFYNLLRT